MFVLGLGIGILVIAAILFLYQESKISKIKRKIELIEIENNELEREIFFKLGKLIGKKEEK